MNTIQSDNLWGKLKELSTISRFKSAAVAYVTDDEFIAFRKGDTLVVDASDQSIKTGRTSAKILNKAFQKGAALYSCDSLHGKAIVFDNHVYVGSANISKNSVNHLNEMGVLSDSPNLISETLQVISELEKTSERIDEAFMKHALSLPVSTYKFGHAKKRKIEIKQPTTWLLAGLSNAKYLGTPEDEKKVDEDNESCSDLLGEEPEIIWYKNNTKFSKDAENGDIVIYLEKDSKGDVPSRVFRHAIIRETTAGSKMKSFHIVFDKNSEVEWSIFKDELKRLGTDIGSGRDTMRKLKPKISEAMELFFSYETI